MRIAILSAARDSWKDVPELLRELRTALSPRTEIEPTVWLIDDAALDAPDSWHSLATAGSEVHVLELRGRQGRDRAFTTALGYLLFEREERYDAFLLLDFDRPEEARRLEALFETAQRHPGSVVRAPGGARRGGGLAARFSYRAKCLLLRACCGERVVQSPAILIPPEMAETLCHSCYGANHLEAALRRLNVPAVTAPLPRAGCGMNVIGAAAVFRDQVFARAFHASAWLFAFTLMMTAATLGLRLSGKGFASPVLWAAPLLVTVLAALAALASFLFGVFNQSLYEIRRWTPALDAPLLVRSVTRVKRQPYAVGQAAP